MASESNEEKVERLTNELNAAREVARELHSVIGWARGQFGSLSLACEPEHIGAVVEGATAGYKKMNEIISNKHYRTVLWEEDDSPNGYKPRVN